jgi:uncharacterized protein
LPYFDTSVVVAYYLPERLSTHVQEIYEYEIGPAVSDLVELELFAALSLRLRLGDLERAQVERVSGLFLRHLADGLYTRIPVNAGHYHTARGFIARFDLPLKAPDALHLAVSAAESLKLVTADGQLARNAEALGVEVDLVRG